MSSAWENNNMRYLCFDISNMLHRTFYTDRNEADDIIAGLATHSALVTLNKYFKKFKPDRVVMAFDRHSWRKDYTASEVCVSKKPYKGTRRQNMTPAQQIKYAKFKTHMREFEQLIDQHTTIITLIEDDLEADDLIAGFCQKFANSPDDEIIVISTDTDMLQLLKYDNVSIISPATDKPQLLEEYDGDAEWYLFTKCIRGDTTDNVQSAFPGVRKTRLEKAYKDPFELVQLMKEKWSGMRTLTVDGELVTSPVTYTVEDLYNENRILIDLEKQPEDIRALISASVNAALARERHFSMFFILKYIGKFKLTKIRDSLDQYVPMLSRH